MLYPCQGQQQPTRPRGSSEVLYEIVHLLPKILHKCTPYSIPSIAESTIAEYSQKCAAGASVLSLSLPPSPSLSLSIYLSVPMLVNAVREL
jgi:hypothetical protein